MQSIAKNTWIKIDFTLCITNYNHIVKIPMDLTVLMRI